MKFYPLCIFAAASLLFSCKNGADTGVIRLDGTFNDNYLESWEYIILEDDNLEAELGEITQPIQYDDGLFFIHSAVEEDNNHATIKVFDRSGRYLNNIGRIGRAANECLSLDYWTLDRVNNELIVAQGNGYGASVTIKRYDYKGNFIGKTETDTLGYNCILMGIAKIESDGTLLIQDGRVHSSPSHEFFHIHPDGSISTPLELSEYHLNYTVADMSTFFINGVIGTDMEAGNIHTEGSCNRCSDTTYVLRKMDNNIYRLYGDKAESVAKIPFLADAPDRLKKGIDYKDEEQSRDYSACSFIDMNDFVYFGLYSPSDADYLFDKSTKRFYEMEIDTINASLPIHGYFSIYDNELISYVDMYYIDMALDIMDSKDYDHRYKPDVEAFYRKARNCKNPPIIIAHYK